MFKSKKPRPYTVMWNELAGWSGRVVCRSASFKTEKARFRFCRKLIKNSDFVGIVKLTNY